MVDSIYIHSNTIDEYDYQKAIELLTYYGYNLVLYNDSNTIGTNVLWVVDKRSPSWRGWRDILSCISWRHYDKTVEYNRNKVLDKMNEVCYTKQEEEDSTCYT